MRPGRWMVVCGLWGCAVVESGEPSWVQDLQIVALQADPPLLAPDTPLQVRVTVVEPDGGDLEVAVWACTLLEEGCLEREHAEAAGLPLSSWARAGDAVDDTFEVTFDLPIAPEVVERAALSGARVALWAVACQAGACDPVGEVAADPAVGSAAYQRVADLLSDPEGWLATSSWGTATGAVTRIPVRGTADNTNPLVLGPPAARFGGLTGRGVELDVVDATPGDRRPRIRGYSTVGPVEAAMRSEGRAVVTWDAHPGSGAGRLYVVVQDGLGGVGVWRGDVAGGD